MKALGELYFLNTIRRTLGSKTPLVQRHVLHVTLVLTPQHLELSAHATPENMPNAPRLQDGVKLLVSVRLLHQLRTVSHSYIVDHGEPSSKDSANDPAYSHIKTNA